MKGFLFAPGGPGQKVVNLDEFFEYLQSVEAHGDEASIYAAVAWVFRCVQIRANAIADLPWKVYRGKTESNWTLPMRDLLWRTEAALLLFGASYWLKKSKGREVTALQWLNPSSMKVMTTAQGISHFEQEVGGQIKKYKVADIVYLRSWNPGDDLGPGIGPGRVALEAAGLARNANQWAASFFEHGAIPGVILTAEGRIDEAEQKRLETTWDKFVAGVKKFRTVAMGSGLTAQVVGSPVKDVAMQELMQQCREQIAAAFGIPQTLIEDAANYATSKEHRKSLYVETIIPESSLIAEGMNDQLFSQLPRPLEWRFLPEELEIMQEEERDRSEAVLNLVQAGMRLEAALAILGMDIPEGVDITPVALSVQVPTPQIRSWSGDLNRWKKKALRHLSETKSAVCDFESDTIPQEIADRVRYALGRATTENEVKAIFAGTFANMAHIFEVLAVAQDGVRQMYLKELEKNDRAN